MVQLNICQISIEQEIGWVTIKLSNVVLGWFDEVIHVAHVHHRLNLAEPRCRSQLNHGSFMDEGSPFVGELGIPLSISGRVMGQNI